MSPKSAGLTSDQKVAGSSPAQRTIRDQQVTEIPPFGVAVFSDTFPSDDGKAMLEPATFPNRSRPPCNRGLKNLSNLCPISR